MMISERPIIEEDTATLALEGRVPGLAFGDGVRTLSHLMDDLTHEIAPEIDIAWYLNDREQVAGYATLVGEAKHAEAQPYVTNVVQGFDKVGIALAAQRPLPYPNDKIAKHAHDLSDLTRRYPSIEEVRFESQWQDSIISHVDTARAVLPQIVLSYGSVFGRIQTITNRRTLRFSLYDTLHNKAISCYLRPQQEDLLRTAWGRLARVAGRVSRDAATGRVLAIREITQIVVHPDTEPGAFERARGILDWPTSGPTSAEAIRLVRDGDEAELPIHG